MTFDRLVSLTTASALFLFQAANAEGHCRTDGMKGCLLTHGRPAKRPELHFPVCRSKKGNVGRCRKPQRQTWSEESVNYKQFFLQWMQVGFQQQAGVSRCKNLQKLTHCNSWGLQVSATPSSNLTLMTWKSHCIIARSMFQNRLFLQKFRFQ